MKKHMHKYVLVQLKDGTSIDGIVVEMDDDNVYLAVPMSDAEAMADMRRAVGAFAAPLLLKFTG
ncbi:hypothetical protein [Paenibacillus alkalitolerans]|uniref:hypothetical protein n=1 Tax=Paenibacillus alkalitolerans TaxID=2799335 RepID=UPI0018F5AF0E|nr:hypothetical protein [Paenibacillus alkalitolerans]